VMIVILHRFNGLVLFIVIADGTEIVGDCFARIGVLMSDELQMGVASELVTDRRRGQLSLGFEIAFDSSRGSEIGTARREVKADKLQLMDVGHVP